MLQKKNRSAKAKGWRKFVHDEFILAFGALVLIAWLAAAFTIVTGFTFHLRRGRLTKIRPATPAEIQSVWHVPALVTVLCTPILIWRVWKVRQ